MLEYRDGVASELVTYAKEKRGVEDVLQEFQELNNRRWRLTNAIRWLLAERKQYLDRSAGGTWHYGDVGFSSEFNVHEELNRSLKKCADDGEAFEDWMEKTWIRLEPSEMKKLANWLKKDGPPENEIECDEDKFESYGSNFIESALACARDDISAFLSSLEDGEKYTAEMVEEFAKTRGKDPGSKLIRRLAEKLPGVEVCHDLSKPGRISFEFKDGEDHYDLVVRGKKLSKKAEKLGLEAAAEELAGEFHELGRKRIQFLNALSKLMGDRGYARDGGGFLESEWVFGRECREFYVRIGKSLTNKLKKQPPEELLQEFFLGQQLEQPAKAELLAALKAGKDEIQTKHLPAYIIQFNDANSLSPEEIDALARVWVEKIREQICLGKRSDNLDVGLWTWGVRRWYTRPKDAWVDEKFWIDLAEKGWEKMPWEDAAKILAVNGDFRSVLKFQEWLDDSEGYESKGYLWHDGDEDIVMLLRDHLEFEEDALEWDSCPKIFGEPPFQVADKWIHRVRAGLGNDAGEDEREDMIDAATHLRRQEIERFFNQEEICQIKKVCSEKLLCLDEEFPAIEGDVLEVAEEMGWRELGLDLLNQPWFSHVFYEPESGLMNAGEILQWLSLICPGPEVAKHCGRILQMSPKNVAERLNLKKFCDVDMENIQSSLVKAAQAETAIAWLRCREVM